MLDISFGQFVVVSTVALMCIGRKDLPKAARMAGQGVGNSVSFLRFVRKSADKLTAEIEAGEGATAKDIKSLKDEVMSGMREFESVRSDLQMGVDQANVRNIMRPRRATPVPGNPAQPNPVAPAPAPHQVYSAPVASAHALHTPSSAQTSAAVAESTWRGEVSQNQVSSRFDAVGERSGGADDGATALSDLLKDNLVIDHYEELQRKKKE